MSADVAVSVSLAYIGCTRTVNSEKYHFVNHLSFTYLFNIVQGKKLVGGGLVLRKVDY